MTEAAECQYIVPVLLSNHAKIDPSFAADISIVVVSLPGACSDGRIAFIDVTDASFVISALNVFPASIVAVVSCALSCVSPLASLISSFPSDTSSALYDTKNRKRDSESNISAGDV